MTLDPRTLREARARLLRLHHEAGVGHLGGNLSALDLLLVLHHGPLRGEDRLVLSKGHAAGALYVALWSAGRLDEAELSSFHADGTRLPGHPPARGLDGVEVGTGSLGHGLPIAAGMALGRRLRGAPGRVHCLTSDGDWQAGATWEALALAVHRGLSNLVIWVDGNGLQGFGAVDEVGLDPRPRIEAHGVEVRELDGHDLAGLVEAASSGSVDASAASPDPSAASPAASAGPAVRWLRTVKGRGVPGLEGRVDSHYLPLTDAQYRAALAALDDPSGGDPE